MSNFYCNNLYGITVDNDDNGTPKTGTINIIANVPIESKGIDILSDSHIKGTTTTTDNTPNMGAANWWDYITNAQVEGEPDIRRVSIKFLKLSLDQIIFDCVAVI